MPRISKEEAVYGKEPEWDNSQSVSVSSSLYWYQNVPSSSQRKTWAIEYFVESGHFKQEELEAIPEFYLGTIGAMCRMVSRGYVPSEKEWNTVLSLTKSRIDKFNTPVSEDNMVSGIPASQIDPVGDKLGRTLDLFDHEIDLVLDGAITWTLPDINESLTKSQFDELIQYYTSEMKEVDKAYSNTDEDVVESYEQVPRMVLRRLIKLYTEIIEKLKASSFKKSATRKPRKKKYKPNNVLVENLKFLEHDPESGFSSIKPEGIIGCQKLVMFNTNNRALTVFYAADSTGIQVKGSTLQNVDFDKSASKTLRKPEKQLPEFLKAAKIRTDKYFAEIKAVGKPVTGRVNKHCLLIKKFN